MSRDLEAPVQIGEVLASKYRVDRVLGVGGMGVVVAATHLQLDQIVALKFVRREALADPDIISRFEREARAAVRLKSEHAARIIDVGRLETGSPYIVMEYLEGQDLAALLEQRRSLPVALACDFIIQACDAISEAHSLGIVHRDLKPGNLFLATTSHGRETVKVLDFGISKSHGATGDPSMTRTHAIMGSPGYMSPEQMRSSKNVDGRTDIWSLGVILYELIAGRVPFHADTFTALCIKIAMDPLPPMPAIPAAAPAGFEPIVRRALEKDPALRYQSAVELAHALAPFASPLYRDRAYQLVSLTAGGPASASHLMPTMAAANTLDAAAGQAPGTALRIRSRKRLLAGAGAGAAALVIALAFAVSRGPDRGPGGADHAGDPAADRAAKPVAGPAEPAAPPRAVAPPAAPAVIPPAAPIVPAGPAAPVAPGPSGKPAAPIDAGVDADVAPRPIDPPRPNRDKPKDRPRPAVDPFSTPD